jgi:hypothetical protein
MARTAVLFQSWTFGIQDLCCIEPLIRRFVCLSSYPELSRKEQRLQCAWRDTDSQLLQQLSLEHPDAAEEFPCYLSKGAGVDKKLLLHSIILDASKGTGPSATAESLHRKHHHFHGSQAVKWWAAPLFVFQRQGASIGSRGEG